MHLRKKPAEGTSTEIEKKKLRVLSGEVFDIAVVQSMFWSRCVVLPSAALLIVKFTTNLNVRMIWKNIKSINTLYFQAAFVIKK